MLLFAQSLALIASGLYGSFILAVKDDSWLIDRGTDAAVALIHYDIKEEIRQNAEKHME